MLTAAQIATRRDVVAKTIAALRAREDLYDQSKYARRTDCGTAYCLAGHVVQHVDGFERLRDGYFIDSVRIGGAYYSIHAGAARALHLCPGDAEVVFACHGRNWPGGLGDRWTAINHSGRPLYERQHARVELACELLQRIADGEFDKVTDAD